MWLSLLFLFLTIVSSGCVPSTDLPTLDVEKGIVLLKHHKHGDYYQYIPASLSEASQVLVVVHGSLEQGKPATYLAEKFIRRWVDFAEEKNLILVSPAFDRKNYQAYGGYRGLFGRNVGADEFVDAVVKDYNRALGDIKRRFYLYGHSAGGQFVIRYVVRHPERIQEAVASAPGRYAFPSPTAPWPHGMGRMERDIKYSNPSKTVKVDFKPNAKGWLEAAALPITVVVGSQDLEEQPRRPGHRGKTRIDLARNWAFDMQQLARENSVHSRVIMMLVEDVGHNSSRLTPYCMQAFTTLQID